MKTLIWIIIILVVLAGGVWLGMQSKGTDTPAPIVLSFEDCVTAGYPVMESFPRQCRTPDGRTFAEEITPPITYVNATDNLIRVETPTPGAVTGKEFSVMGQARGTWFFEASFPVELLDKD